MAYIDAETTKKIRQALKAQFPSCKFSVRKDGNIALNVSIMKSPFFDDGEYRQVNHYWLERNYEQDQAAFMKTVLKTIKEAGEHYDNSDPMTDYFECAFYIHLHIGQYDKPHVRLN